MAEMQIQIGADVNSAIRGLQQVEAQSQKTFQKVSQSSGAATQSMINLSRVVQDAPYGFIGIANNLNPLVESFQRLKAESGSTGGAFKALGAALTGPAGIGLAVGLVSALLVKFGDALFSASKASKELAEQQKKIADEQKNIVEGIGSENAQVSVLVSQLGKENLSRQQKEGILKKLTQINPVYFGDLKNEEGLINNVNAAYDKYLKSLVRRTEAAVLQKDLERISAQILELERRGAVPLAQLPAGVSFEENRKITQENLKQLSLSTQLQSLLNERSNLLTVISEKSDIPVNITADKGATKKLARDIKINFDILLQDIKVKNPVLEALKSPKSLSEYEQIGKIINDSIAKNIKPLPSILNPQIQNDLEDQKKALQAQLQFAQSAANGISNAFDQAFSSILQGENVFKSLGEALKGFVLQLVQATLKALIFRAIVNAIVPGGAAALGATGLGNLLGFRANGGPVTGRSPYIVGERGPELFVPSVSGSIVPNNQLGSFNGRPAFAGAMGGRSIVRGNDILLTYARTQRSQSRVNG